MLDHEAIIKAYPDCVQITDADGAFKSDGSEGLEKIELDQSLVDAARVTLDTEYAAIKYKDDRKSEYPDWGAQLDYIYHNGLDKWKTDIVDPVKAKYPKPS